MDISPFALGVNVGHHTIVFNLIAQMFPGLERLVHTTSAKIQTP